MFDFFPIRGWSTLKKLIWLKAAALSKAVLKTVTGNPIHILDALAKPAQALSVKLEPVQDLHGYDSPWPAGGGKNKFNGTFLRGYWAYADGGWVNSNTWIATEKIPCKPSTSYTASADAKLTRWQGFVWYDANGDYISTDNLQSNVNIGLTKTSPSTAAYLIFNIAGYPNSTDTIAPSDVTHFQLEEGSASTAYSPYANICPISGWTGANVTRTGKNLFALIGANTTDVIPTINETTGEVSIADTTAIKWASKPFGYSDVVAEQTYIFSATGIKYGRIGGSINTTYPNASTGNIPGCTTSGGGITALVTKNATERTFTPHFTGRIYWHFCTDTDNGSSHQAFTMTPMIELGSTASDYQPYVGTTYPIPLGQTVYGGTLDVTTGKLTVNLAMVDLGAKNWYSSTAAGRTRFRASITDIERISSPNVRASLLCSNYPTKTANQTYQGTIGVSLQQNESDIYIYDPQMESMTTAEFKSAMSGVQLCYKLATPQTYQLTPTEVATLLGDNTIWADTGDTTAEYRADTKLYIERLTAPDSADMIADANITSGQYFMVGNSLYKATANIANGGQITVGTNCTRVSLAQALNEINA